MDVASLSWVLGLLGVAGFLVVAVVAIRSATGAKTASASTDRARVAAILSRSGDGDHLSDEEAAQLRQSLERIRSSEPWQPNAPTPALTSSQHRTSLTPREAEEHIAAWMRQHGVHDAIATRLTNDGGIDVRSSTVLAQVKHYIGTVGPAPVRELVGVIQMDAGNRTGAFFTSGTYSSGAVAAAAAGGIALFRYDLDGSDVRAANAQAHALLR
ncbi:restriction endonuclease [Agrococcus jejuensis]|uniref:restriction endonuclease n=1 Tax=Agrococcus jejuensis TaxID=399736 RepID=UPI0011A6D0F5|nr:restriction endonuclease [Agrococcus jejuensis]